jgi:hypothetical protein
MANAVEDALNRASPEVKARNQQALDEVRSIMRNVPAHEAPDNIRPAETPSTHPNNKDIDKVQLKQNDHSALDNAKTAPSQNYLYPNAVDRAQERPSKEPQKPQPEPEKEH